MNEKDLIERYIYEVTKRVPQDMRKEIKPELETLIQDMCEEEDNVEVVLEKLGDPAEFAKKYRGDNNYVIGPDYYDNYIWIIKICTVAIGISAVVSAIVHGLTGAEDIKDFFKEFFKEGMTTVISGVCAMAGVVTIIFAILEHYKVKVDIKPENKWAPSALPEIPHKKSLISRTDSIIGIVFMAVLAGVLAFVPELFGLYESTDNGIKCVSCIFNLEEWSSILPLFLFVLIVAVFDEIVKLIYGQYCKAVMYCSIICNIVGVAVTFIIFKCVNVWNMEFDEAVLENLGKTGYSKGDILNYWGSDVFNNAIVGLFGFISCIEVAVIIYKTYKYGKR